MNEVNKEELEPSIEEMTPEQIEISTIETVMENFQLATPVEQIEILGEYNDKIDANKEISAMHQRTLENLENIQELKKDAKFNKFINFICDVNSNGKLLNLTVGTEEEKDSIFEALKTASFLLRTLNNSTKFIRQTTTEIAKYNAWLETPDTKAMLHLVEAHNG